MGGRWRGPAGDVKKFPSGSDSRRGLGMEGKSGAEAGALGNGGWEGV